MPDASSKAREKLKLSRAVAGLIERKHVRRRAGARNNRHDLLALTAKRRRL